MGLFDWFKRRHKKKKTYLSYGDRMVLKYEKAEQKRLKEKKRITNLKNSFKECPNCDTSINPATMFFCPYCEKGFCEVHRLPEDHKCKKPKLPHYMKKGYGVKKPNSSSNYGDGRERETNY